MAPGFPRPVRQLPVTSNPVPGPSFVPSSLAPRHVSCSHVESLSSGRGLTNRLRSDTPPSGVDKVVSLKEMKSEDRVRKANRWLACTECVWDISDVLAPLRGQSIDLVLSLLRDRVASSFHRHVFGWKSWVYFCTILSYSVEDPSFVQLVDFLQS